MSYLAARFHQRHQGPIKALAAGHDRIATGGVDGVVHVMTLGGDHVGAATIECPINGVALAPDGRVAIAAKDGSVRVYDPAVRRTYSVGDHDHWEPDGPGVRRVVLGHPVNSIDWVGDLIAAASGDRKVYLTDGDGSLRR